MKKALLILIIVLSVNEAFASQEVKYRDYGYPGGGIIAGSVVMMTLSSLPLTFCTAVGITAATGYLGFLTGGFLMAIGVPFILSFQTLLSGAMLLHYAVRKYVRGDYYLDAGEMMRNDGIIIMTTSLIPIACCAGFSAFLFPIAIDIITGILALGQLAVGAVFLGLGLRRIHSYKIPLPEVSLTHDDKKGFNEGYGMSFGMRIRI